MMIQINTKFNSYLLAILILLCSMGTQVMGQISIQPQTVQPQVLQPKLPPVMVQPPVLQPKLPPVVVQPPVLQPKLPPVVVQPPVLTPELPPVVVQPPAGKLLEYGGPSLGKTVPEYGGPSLGRTVPEYGGPSLDTPARKYDIQSPDTQAPKYEFKAPGKTVPEYRVQSPTDAGTPKAKEGLDTTTESRKVRRLESLTQMPREQLLQQTRESNEQVVRLTTIVQDLKIQSEEARGQYREFSERLSLYPPPSELPEGHTLQMITSIGITSPLELASYALKALDQGSPIPINTDKGLFFMTMQEDSIMLYSSKNGEPIGEPINRINAAVVYSEAKNEAKEKFNQSEQKVQKIQHRIKIERQKYQVLQTALWWKESKAAIGKFDALDTDIPARH